MERATITSSFTKRQGFSSHQRTDNKAPSYRLLLQNKIKRPKIQVHGSGNLIQMLLKHDLVDEFWLKVFPITLGVGKRLFAEGTIPAGFKLESEISPSGVIIASYERVSEVKTWSFGLETPSEAELARRKRLKEEE
jgi:dihydrofolate reductase